MPAGPSPTAELFRAIGALVGEGLQGALRGAAATAYEGPAPGQPPAQTQPPQVRAERVGYSVVRWVAGWASLQSAKRCRWACLRNAQPLTSRPAPRRQHPPHSPRAQRSPRRPPREGRSRVRLPARHRRGHPRPPPPLRLRPGRRPLSPTRTQAHPCPGLSTGHRPPWAHQHRLWLARLRLPRHRLPRHRLPLLSPLGSRRQSPRRVEARLRRHRRARHLLPIREGHRPRATRSRDSNTEGPPRLDSRDRHSQGPRSLLPPRPSPVPPATASPGPLRLPLRKCAPPRPHSPQRSLSGCGRSRQPSPARRPPPLHATARARGRIPPRGRRRAGWSSQASPRSVGTPCSRRWGRRCWAWPSTCWAGGARHRQGALLQPGLLLRPAPPPRAARRGSIPPRLPLAWTRRPGTPPRGPARLRLPPRRHRRHPSPGSRRSHRRRCSPARPRRPLHPRLPPPLALAPPFRATSSCACGAATRGRSRGRRRGDPTPSGGGRARGTWRR